MVSKKDKQALGVVNEIQTKLEERERAKRDKLYLATQVLGYDFQPEVHAELFEQYVQFDGSKAYKLQSDIKSRMILWPRGHFKTTSITVEIIQTILNFPNIRIVIMQGGLSNTQAWLSEIKAHFLGTATGSRLMELFPEFCTGAKGKVSRGNAMSWTTPARTDGKLRQATITVASSKALTTGLHFDVGFFDDLVNQNNYRNPKLLEKVAEEFKMFIPLIDPGGYRYVTGTRYAFRDLYQKILELNKTQNTWTISIKNCWTDDGKGVRFPQFTNAKGEIHGFTRESLKEIEIEQGLEMFACQYLNQPVHGKLQIFSAELVNGCLLSAQDPKTLGFHQALGIPEIYPLPQEKVYELLGPSILVIDLASSKKSDRDHSVIFCGKADNYGRPFIVECRGDRWDSHTLAMNVIEMAMLHRPMRIMIEGTAAGKYAMDYIQLSARMQGVFLPLDLIPVNNQKDAKNFRISAIVAPMKKKQIIFFDNLARWSMIFEQFTQFDPNRDQHDDYPDTIGLLLEQFRTVTPPPKRPRHPMFSMMAAGTDITRTVTEERTPDGEGLGGDFCC